MTKRTVTILGATGTIGDNMLALMRTHADKATLFGVSAHKNEEKFSQIISEFQPQFASISSLSKEDSLLPDICAKHGTELLIGDDAHEMLAKMSVDLVVGAIVGMAGFHLSLPLSKQGGSSRLPIKISCLSWSSHHARFATDRRQNYPC